MMNDDQDGHERALTEAGSPGWRGRGFAGSGRSLRGAEHDQVFVHGVLGPPGGRGLVRGVEGGYNRNWLGVL